MNEVAVSLFVGIDDFSKISFTLFDDKIMPICLKIEVIEQPLHVRYYCDEDGEEFEFYPRLWDGNYEEPDFVLSAEDLDDVDSLPEEIRAIAGAYYSFAHNMNCVLTNMGIYERIASDDELQEVGGLIVEMDGTSISCQTCYGKERPNLACFTPDDGISLSRPYVEEIEENMNDIFGSLDVKIQRAHEGNVSDMRDLAYRFLCGIEAETDYKQAMAYAKMLMKNNDTFGYYVAGVLYATGCGVRRNYSKAIELIQPYQDDCYCGDLYDIIKDMDILYVQKNDDLNQKLEYMRCLLDLRLFLRDNGMQFNGTELVKLSKQLLKEKCPVGYFYLGRCVEEHDELSKAIEYYRKGESLNEPQCMTKLAHLHLDGAGVRKSKKKAIALFKRAAAEGFYYAYRFLGDMCMENSKFEEAASYYMQYLEYEEDPDIREFVDDLMIKDTLVN